MDALRTRLRSSWTTSSRLPLIQRCGVLSVVALGAMLCLAAPGCKSPPTWISVALTPAADKTSESSAEATDEVAASDQPTEQVAPEAQIPEAIHQAGWVRTVPTPSGEMPSRHWTHAGLQGLLDVPVRRRPDLIPLLADKNPIVVANAAILLGNWGNEQSLAPLENVIRSKDADLAGEASAGDRPAAGNWSKQALALRCAAAEALGHLRSPQGCDRIQSLLNDYGPSDPVLAVHGYQTELHVELLCSLSRVCPAANDRRFRLALESRAPQIRAVALEAWGQDLAHDLPREAVELRLDASPQVRVAALRAIAAHRASSAHEYLCRGVNDQDRMVQLVAVEALAVLGTDEARMTLRSLKADPSEFVRMAAVRGLAACGEEVAAAEALVDKSSKVREALADTLRGLPRDAEAVKQQAQLLAKDLARDVNVEVQKHAVAALEEWPLEKAGPVLLTAMASNNFQARRVAQQQLAKRWEPAAEFPVDGTPAARAESLQSLEKQFALEVGPLKEVAETVRQAKQLVELSQQQINELQYLVQTLNDPQGDSDARRQARKLLLEKGPELLQMLEQQAFGTTDPLPLALYEEVLPQLNPAFRLLMQLQSKKVSERREAAAELAKFAASLAGEPMPEAALRRLACLIENEPDALVWQSVLTAIRTDPREAAAELAYLAVGSASEEVRRRAVEYMEAQPQKRHVKILLTLLSDPATPVVLETIRALGAQGSLEDPRPLLALLVAKDVQIQLETARALARCEVQEGVQTLNQFARSANQELRLRAVQTMADIPNPLYLPTLIDLLDGPAELQRAALLALPKLVGQDICATDDGHHLLPQEKCRRWRQWHREQGQNLPASYQSEAVSPR